MDIIQNYIRKGSGFPLILLHGNGEDLGYFEYQTDFFSKNHSVFALDTRGHGKTPKGTAPFTLMQFAEDLLGFLDAQQIEKTDLLGFSDGGNIALLFALAHPERVRRLILNGANLNPRGVKASFGILIGAEYLLAKLFSKTSSAAKEKAELYRLMVKEPHIAPERLQNLHIPTLVIAGTHDLIRRTHTELIAHSIPGAELCLLEGDHCVARGNPTAFNETVRRFLEAE